MLVAAEVAAVLDSIPDGHALYLAERDATGRLIALPGVYMNHDGLALKSMSLEDFLGSDLLTRTRGLGSPVATEEYLATLNGQQETRRTLVTDELSGTKTFEVNAKRLLLGDQEMLSVSFRDVTHELRSRRRMQHAVELAATHSRTDELTGLPNRRGWQAAVDLAFSTDNVSVSVSVAIADLDHFKSYNDTFGHAAGDQLLRDVANSWSQLLTTQQCLARLGGDEFSLLLPGIDAPTTAEALERFSTAMPAGQTVSVGVAVRRDEEAPSQALARADQALYVAKRGGRARVVVAP